MPQKNLILVIISLLATSSWAAPPALPWPEAQKIVDQIQQPNIPARTITASGLVGDGRTDNTAAFARAIDACSAAGGGHLVIPPGNYVSGSIHLKSHVDLHLENGAIILFSADVSKYPLEQTRYQGIDLMNNSPLIGAIDQTDIAITGQGVLDASATSAWNKDGKGNWNILVGMGTAGTPISRRIFGKARPLRTTCLEPNGCKNVLIQGITIRGSHFWQIHPLLCENVTVDGVTTQSRGSQTDGCDPDSCDHVLIKNCTLGADDDCIAIKSGRDPDSQRVHQPSQNIVIMNTQFHGPWGMITCGSEQTEGIQHVYAYNLSTIDDIPDVLHRTGVRSILFFKTNSRRGGFIRDIHIDSVRARCNGAILWGFLNYSGNGKETGTNYPIVQDIYLSHISDTQATSVFDLTGLTNDPIRNVVFSDCAFTNITRASKSTDVQGMVFKNCTLNGKPLN